MVWPATDKAEVANVAVPLASVAVPRLFVPSRKVTVPVGVPAPGATAATVAVNVTGWPDTVGLAEAVTVLVVLAWLTVCVRAADVLVEQLGAAPETSVVLGGRRTIEVETNV